jgi:hypothetical protein
MSVSFRMSKRSLLALVAVFACTTLTGCLAFGHNTPKPSEPSRDEQEQRRRFAGTWGDGEHSQLTISADGEVSGILARPTTGSFFDGRESSGVLHLGSLSGATPVRLVPGNDRRCSVMIQVLSASPAEDLTLCFCVNRQGDQLRVRARSDRREETYTLTNNGATVDKAG